MATLFTDDHEWLQIDGDIRTVGITDFAQTQLGDVGVCRTAESRARAEEDGARRNC